METPAPQPVPEPTPQPVPEPVPFGKDRLDMYLQHDRVKNTMKVQGTLLLQRFAFATTFMEDIHRRVLGEVERKYKWDSYVARTVHAQLAAVVKRYLELIESKLLEWYPPFDGNIYESDPADYYRYPQTRDEYIGDREWDKFRDLQAAVFEAEQLEVRAKSLIDKFNEERTRGNIQFVAKIETVKANFIKRAS